MCCSGAPAGAGQFSRASGPAAGGSKRYALRPLARKGRLLRHLCFSSSFPRLFNPGGQGYVKGARAHRAQRGRPLTWPRRDYLALPEEEEKRRSNRQPRAAARGRSSLWYPAAMAGGQGQEHATRHRCPGSTQPGSKRPFDLPRSAATQGGCGGHCPPAAWDTTALNVRRACPRSGYGR